MNKLFEDKLDYWQWRDAYELKYNVMPAWWWNESVRKKNYENYLKEYDNDQ
jgi:hypothetical protein